MAWLGEALPKDDQSGASPFAPRCTKDLIEEALFDRRRDMFSGLELVFFDTTSLYFEGEKLQAPDRRVSFILGARLRNVKEIKETVLSHPGRYQEVYGPREHSKDPSPLKVKNVQIGERRYVVCVNAEQVRKDQTDREAIVRALEEQLRAGPQSLVGNKGYRKFLKSTGSRFASITAR